MAGFLLLLTYVATLPAKWNNIILAYRLKFISKKTMGQDYVVPPLEGLWWAEDMIVGW
jgi:hypothetical protein